MKIIHSFINTSKFVYNLFYNLLTKPKYTIYGANFKPIYIPRFKHLIKNSNEYEEAKSYFLNKEYLSKNEYMESYNLIHDKYKAKIQISITPYNGNRMCPNAILGILIFLNTRNLYYSDLKDLFDFVTSKIKLMITNYEELKDINDLNLICDKMSNTKYRYFVEVNNNHSLFTEDNKLKLKVFNIFIVCDKNKRRCL